MLNTTESFSWNDILTASLPEGHAIGLPEILFKKIEDEAIDAQLHKLEKSKQEKNNDEKKPLLISKYKKNLNDYIIVLDNIIPHDLCDEILNEYALTDEWRRAQVGYNEINETRNVDTIGISSPSIIEKNLEKRKIIDEKIFKVAGEAIKRYNIIFPNFLV
jgi:hypothetical protein